MTDIVSNDHLWKNAFKSCEVTLSLLAPLEQENALVQEAIRAIKQLVHSEVSASDCSEEVVILLSEWNDNPENSQENLLLDDAYCTDWDSLPPVSIGSFEREKLLSMTNLERQKISRSTQDRGIRPLYGSSPYRSGSSPRPVSYQDSTYTKEPAYGSPVSSRSYSYTNTPQQGLSPRYPPHTADSSRSSPAPESRPRAEADLPFRTEDLALNDIPEKMGVHMIYHPDQLDRIPIPSEKYVCLVSFQRSEGQLRILQLFLASQSKLDAYLIHMDPLYGANKEQLRSSRLGYFLTGREVSRGIWDLEYIQNTLLGLGIGAGPSVNLPMVIKLDSGRELSLDAALNHYLADWKDLETLRTKEQAAKKLARSSWHEKGIPRAIIEYSAFEGLALAKVYTFFYEKSHAGNTK